MLLELRHLHRRFGGLRATQDVSFGIEQGQIKGIIGPNGAGKTTLFNLIAGKLRPNDGQILLQGEEVTHWPAHRIAAHGVARTFQQVCLVPGMSVLDQVQVGRHVRTRSGFVASMIRWPAMRREERASRQACADILHWLKLDDVASAEAASLPFGRQRLVELARAMAAEPSLLLLDEPASGLNDRETGELAATIREIRQRGITVLVVEHDMALVMDICDEVIVIDHGQKLAEDTPRAIQRNEEVIRIYLGDDDAEG